MKNLKNYLFAIAAITLLWSCQKEETGLVEERNEVQFFACYNEAQFTKAPQAFPLNNKATIYGYTAGNDVTTKSPVSGTPVDATALIAGVLTPSPLLYLPKGSYDFYSVSLNSSTAPGLTFTSGVSGQLSNDIDYVWSKVSEISQGGIVNFSYKHKAVCLEMNVVAGNGVTSLVVKSITTTASQPSASSKMTLSDGSIAPTSTVSTPCAMTISENKGTKIMLPLSSNALAVEVTVDATIGGTQVNSKKYSATLPAIAYISGNYYTINLTVDATSITFSGALVEDWTLQTLSNLTLTEQ